MRLSPAGCAALVLWVDLMPAVVSAVSAARRPDSDFAASRWQRVDMVGALVLSATLGVGAPAAAWYVARVRPALPLRPTRWWRPAATGLAGAGRAVVTSAGAWRDAVRSMWRSRQVTVDADV